MIYYSATGHGTKMATHIKKFAEAAGAEVQLRHVVEQVDPSVFEGNPAWRASCGAAKDEPAATGNDIVWADAVIFGSPIRYSNVAGSFEMCIDTLDGLWSQGKLANKAYVAFTSSQTAHGGQETTLQHIYQMVMHFGGIIVAPGYTEGLKFVDGNPYGVSFITGPENQNELDQPTIDALEHMTKRIVEIGGKLAG